MAKSYTLTEGSLVILERDSVRRYRRRDALRFMTRLLGVAIPLAASWIATYFVYRGSVTPTVLPDHSTAVSLSESIATGALFATFGSAVIAVFALAANRSLSLFYEDLSILNQDLVPGRPAGGVWRRWPFLPRLSRLTIKGEKRFLTVRNAAVRFNFGDSQREFAFPTTPDDFRELSVGRDFVEMKLLREKYLGYLTGKDLIDEYPAWDCVCGIYKNVLCYRLSCFFIWIGTCFVLQSIVFAFFYPTFYQLLSR